MSSKSQKKSIGVMVNRSKPGALPLLKALMSWEKKTKGVRFLWEKSTGALIRQPSLPLEVLAKKVELLFVAGGDGTMLEVIRRIYPSQVPVLGLNLGSLGFLTALSEEELPKALHYIAKGNLRLSHRVALQATLHTKEKIFNSACALNEVVISRGHLSKLVRIRLSVGERPVTDYVCDGLIISTPTGSTAYNMAAGGPILSPETHAIALTPIAPHTLTNRSLVLGVSRPLRIEVPSQDRSLVVQVDGKPVGLLKSGDWVDIRPARAPAVLAYLPHTDFFHILRKKLKWAGASL